MTARVCSELGAALLDAGECRRAEEFLRRALHTRTEVFGVDAGDTATTQTALARLLRMAAAPTSSKRRRRGSKAAAAAASTVAPSQLRSRQTQLEEAKTLLQQAIVTRSDVCGDLQEARSRIHLGTVPPLVGVVVLVVFSPFVVLPLSYRSSLEHAVES